jgi:hypothetical protein
MGLMFSKNVFRNFKFYKQPPLLLLMIIITSKKDPVSLLPSLMIDLQPDSPAFELILFTHLKDAAKYKANAETLIAVRE